MVENVSYLALHDGTERRIPPRAPEEMQPNYLERFDFSTLISDVFATPQGVEIVLPPPLNLEEDLLKSEFRVDDKLVPPESFQYRLADRGAYIELLVAPNARDVLEIDGPLGTYRAPIRASGSDEFAGMRVLVTHQKDNDLEWIGYWALHHASLYGFDAVLVYDNGSERYSPSDIERVLAAVPRLRAFKVVPWPTPFGLTAGPDSNWDSDFGQHVFLRGAYSRFLREAELALICDIDELLVSESEGLSVSDLVPAGAEPITYLRRRQIVQVLAPGMTEDAVRTHGSYGYAVSEAGYISNKYILAPKAMLHHRRHWLKVHGAMYLPGRSIDPETAHIRHFGGIRIHWRDDWSKRVANVDAWPSTLSLDLPFRRDAAKVAPEWREMLALIRQE